MTPNQPAEATMATITIAAKAFTSIFPVMVAGAVTAVAVNGLPVAFAHNGTAIRLADPLAADAEVVMTYDPANPRAGDIEFRLLDINTKLSALAGLDIAARLAALEDRLPPADGA